MKAKVLTLKLEKGVVPEFIKAKVCPKCVGDAIFKLVPVNNQAKVVERSLVGPREVAQSDIQITSTVCGG